MGKHESVNFKFNFFSMSIKKTMVVLYFGSQISGNERHLWNVHKDCWFVAL